MLTSFFPTLKKFGMLMRHEFNKNSLLDARDLIPTKIQLMKLDIKISEYFRLKFNRKTNKDGF